MAFDELERSLRLPEGASPRYRRLEALGRMLDGRLYEDLQFSFEQERITGKKHIPLRERRPSVDFNLAYEITQDTLAELFGDEQFPIVHVVDGSTEDEHASAELASFIEALGIDAAMVEAYEEGVVGSVGVVVHSSDTGVPYYEVLPGKYCVPVYRSQYSHDLVALVVTYPIDRATVHERFPGFLDDDHGADDTFWYRYVVGPIDVVDYFPMADNRFVHLGETGKDGKRIEFNEFGVRHHGFGGVTPALYGRNFGGKGRELDGTALWWPIRNICIEIDYTLSQAGRGLRYSADPMLFIRKGDLDVTGVPIGAELPAGGMATATASDGTMIKGVTQTLVGEKGSDAKLLEIQAEGIKQEREYAADLREYALEVLGGLRARPQDSAGPMTGRAIDKNLKPLRRLVRRQRRPYGRGLLVPLIELTLRGIARGALSPLAIAPHIDIASIPYPAKYVPEWPTEDVLQGQDLLYHVQALEMAAGGSTSAPLQLIKPEAMGAKLSADVGMHETYEAIKGTLERPVLPGEPAPPPPPPKTP